MFEIENISDVLSKEKKSWIMNGEFINKSIFKVKLTSSLGLSCLIWLNLKLLSHNAVIQKMATLKSIRMLLTYILHKIIQLSTIFAYWSYLANNC